jgi:hypothetical protein
MHQEAGDGEEVFLAVAEKSAAESPASGLFHIEARLI